MTPTTPSWLRQFAGPLTEDLVLHPGEFGLGHVPSRLKPNATTTTVCGFCSTGCGLNVHLREGQAVNLSAAPDYPVNLGMACPKGWEALTPLSAPDRATAPLLRTSRGGKLEPCDWDRALQTFSLKFKALLDQHGPESIAFLSTGQICTEEMAFLGALFKFGMGGRHGDSNTRQCMATSHVAYKQSFGFDAPPYTYADFEESDALVFIGSNLCVAHPILWQRVLRNRRGPEIIVIDPRKTETAMGATQHLAIRPKSDLTLLYGTAQALIARGAVKRDFIDAHTTGYDEFARFVEPFTAELVCGSTGLSTDQFERFVNTLAERERVSFWWTMGVNQSHEATRTAQAIINLALMTGNIGRPGTGPNSITGQCNAMGSRLFANATGLLGGRDFLNSNHRSEVARLLQIPADRIPSQNSLAYDQILDGIQAGTIKGLWIIGTNPVHSWIGQRTLAQQLEKLEFLAVQDMYTSTETARVADLLLPAAGWGEKEGTFINSERRIGYVKRVARAPGQALADFHIFRLITHYWGCESLFREWTSPQAAFQILKRCSAGQPCDFTGIQDYRMLDQQGGIQWPCPLDRGLLGETAPSDSFPTHPIRGEPTKAQSVSADGSHPGSSQPFSAPAPTNHSQIAAERRLFEDGSFFTPDGRARFIFSPPTSPPEATDAEFPFVLLTGRGASAQWHTGTRTDKSDLLRKLAPARCYIELSPADAHRLGIVPNTEVRVRSRRGAVVAMAFVTPTVAPGQVFMPMHYSETNQLTLPSFDPHSRQPSYKHCAVSVQPLTRKHSKASA